MNNQYGIRWNKPGHTGTYEQVAQKIEQPYLHHVEIRSSLWYAYGVPVWTFDHNLILTKSGVYLT